MKKLLFSIVFLFVAGAVAQTTTLSYQAVVRDGYNRLVPDTDIPVMVSVSIGGTEKYYEERTVRSNHNGVVSFSIGGDGRTWPVSGHPGDELSTLSGWNNAAIAVTFRLSGGDVTVNSPVSAVPYALEAANVPAAQVNADWNATSGVAEILNKPNLATVATTGDYGDLSNTPDLTVYATNARLNDTAAAIRADFPTQLQADWTETTITSAAYIQNKPNLATVATTGDYGDLSNTPDLTVYATNARLNDTAAAIRADFPTIPENIAFTTADNNFIGTNTVPRGFDINATNGTNCNNIVVNACDLWAVFDSLNRRITALEEELDSIKNAAPPVFNSITLSDITTTSMKVTASFTSSGFNITSYEFCYSKNADMSTATCASSNSPEMLLEGLDPYTTYYVTVSATNVIGTTTSTVANGRTKANAPTATVSGETTTPAGITVTLSNLNFREPEQGTVQIFYKKKTEATCGTSIADYTSLAVSGTMHNGDPYSQTISSLTEDTVYCVIVKLQNVDTVTYTNPIEVTSGTSNKLVITSQYYSDIEDDDIWICKNAPVSVTYTVHPLVGDIADYEDFTWRYYQSDNAAENHYALPTVSSDVADGSSYTITISATSSSHDAISIECTAKHKVTGDLIKGKWEDLRTRNQVQQNIPTANFNVAYLTVTAMTSYSKVDWGDGSEVQEGVASGTQHPYQNEGTYTVTLINLYPDYYDGAGCIATGTVTVVAPPEIHKCIVTTAHQGAGYENNGYDSGSGAANDGYEETDASGKITSVTDYDGNVYPVVQIGSQCWIAKNMRCEHSPNTGNYIVNSQNKTGDDYFKTYASKSAHWLHNDPDIASSDTGLLYNFCAAADVYNGNGTELNTLNQTSWTPTINTPYHRGICPKGWNLPTYDDWNTLRNNDNANTAAEIAGDGWPSPSGGCGNNNPCGTLNHNLSGFSALLTCYTNYNSWNDLRTDGTGFWASTCTSGKASGCVLTTGSGSLSLQNNYYKFSNLFSVRCVRDSE